ncbi:MAG: transposase [Candidatus Hodarchaeales archaeon]
MKLLYQAYESNFWNILQKSCHFTRREIMALWAIVSVITGSHSFSLMEVSSVFGRKVGRNFLATVLKKYSYVQRKVARVLIARMLAKLPRNTKVYLIIDDTLVQKRGKKIFGSLRWYDHASGRCVQALCLVNVAVVVNRKVVFILPYLLLSTKKRVTRRPGKQKEQDGKSQAAMELLEEFYQWFDGAGISRKRTVVMADSWYGMQPMPDFLRESGVKFRIDSKKNYSVQMVDHEAVNRARRQTRGKKRKRFVKYRRLDQFIRDPLSWRYFTGPVSGERVYHKTAKLTLKTGGQVRIYGFFREGSREPKFIMTDPCLKYPPDPRTVYRDYRLRWRIEEAHRDLKQQFGIGKCQCRDSWIVHGFTGLIYFAYSLFKQQVCFDGIEDPKAYNTPSWAKAFHKNQVYHEMTAKAC